MSNVKNYHEQGGKKWVVRGELELAKGGRLLFNGQELKPALGQTDSEASTSAALKEDFNTLLGRLFAAGLMVVDKTALEAAITGALELLDSAVVGEDVGEYSQAAYDTFESGIETALGVADDAGATQGEVGAALTALTTAKSTFEAAVITVDKSALRAAIDAAQDILDDAEVGSEPGQYPQEAVTAFETAIGAAQAVVENADATQTNVDDAVTALAAAVSTFETAVITE
jgi:uncharacterized protein YecA (UPF0149 family)